MISVPQRFEAKILAIEESYDMTSLTIADLVSKLEAQEQRLATKAVNGKTPLEAWSGSKPSVKHLRMKELGKGIFVGYYSQSKGYRIYNLESKKIVVSRDFIFDEESYWNWEKNDVQKHDLMSISEELVITEDSKNREISDWFDVAGTTDADEVIKTKSLASVYERCNLVFAEPTSFDDAAKVPEWIDAMNSEIPVIEKNARLVVKGYAQIVGVDDGDTFAPVARLDTIRLLIAIAGQLGWNLFHLNVKSAFLNGELEEDIYVCQPEVIGQGVLDDMESTSGYVFNLDSGAICWSSKKQQVVAHSIAEAEYIATAATANQAICSTVLLCDNKSAIAIAENHVQHGRTKHIM
ncbi:hypothetical protein GQ457_08G034630 [Hibiscus cannabinus]